MLQIIWKHFELYSRQICCNLEPQIIVDCPITSFLSLSLSLSNTHILEFVNIHNLRCFLWSTHTHTIISMTRWFECFYLFGHFRQWKLSSSIKDCQGRLEIMPSTKYTPNILPKDIWNLATLDNILPNLVTLTIFQLSSHTVSFTSYTLQF